MSSETSSGESRQCPVCHGAGTVGGHWQAVLASVEHVEGTVTLHKEDIAFATDLGFRRVQQLMDEWAEKPGVGLREYEPATAVNNYEGQKKTLVIDLDQVACAGIARDGGGDA